MTAIFAVDWRSMFIPTVSLVELVLRSAIIFLAILTGLRVFRREMGELSTADVLVIVLIADAAQNAISAEYRSITEGIVVIATIFGLDLLLDWLAYRFTWARRLLHPKPLVLVENGRVNRKHLKAELLTMADLEAQLRKHGVDEIGQVRRCYLEDDGRLSVLRFEPRSQGEETGRKGSR